MELLGKSNHRTGPLEKIFREFDSANYIILLLLHREITL